MAGGHSDLTDSGLQDSGRWDYFRVVEATQNIAAIPNE